uniref:Uncharacterized protein n=1 Tax=viral metagenome TaxID=1070528 RepID=A0A6H2A499_9ZZZZ
MKRETCYQWIIRDNQQLNFNDYILTRKHYSSRAEVDKDWSPENTECCFHPIKPLRMTKQIGELAWVLTRHERKRENKEAT